MPMEVWDMSPATSRDVVRRFSAERKRLIVPRHFVRMPDIKMIGVTLGSVGLSLRFVSCETTTDRAVASNKSKTPPAQNVHPYDGGEMVKPMQQGGGSGVADWQGNFVGGGR